MHRSVWETICCLRQALEPLAWWKRYLGAAFDGARPLLAPCEGVAAKSYPCPVSGARLTVRETGGRYVAFATGDAAGDVPDLDLSWEDVQAWRLDHGAYRRELSRVMKLTGVAADGDGGEIEFAGFCEQRGERRRVYLCHAHGIDAAVRAAADTAGTPGAGCVVFAERHAAAEHVLTARGVGMVALADCMTLDGGGVKGSCSAACQDVRRDITRVDLKEHFDRRFDTLGQEYSGLQRENQELKQNLARVFVSIGQRVDTEFLHWVFVILGQGTVSAAAKHLGIKGSTFDKRLKAYVDRGGLYRTLYLMTGVRRKGSGQKKIDGFNELLLKHQNGAKIGDFGAWKELLDGLEAMNAKNWQGMRDELIDLAKEALVEE